MKSVLISIKPKWCELIASGKKTIEVRKTKPKLETPFKVYIYQTKESKRRFLNDRFNSFHNGLSHHTQMGKVIGEFVCDGIIPISIEYSNPNSRIALKEFPYSCLTDKQIIDYLGNGNQGYGWHISNLVIYDKPRDLREFKKISRDCWYADLGLAKRDCPECKNANCFLQKPPQSWLYVESEVDTE